MKVEADIVVGNCKFKTIMLHSVYMTKKPTAICHGFLKTSDLNLVEVLSLTRLIMISNQWILSIKSELNTN